MKDTKMTLIADTRLVTRVAMGMGIALCIMIALSLYGINQVNGISESLIAINKVNSVKQRYAINFRGSVHYRAIDLRDVVLIDEPTVLRNVLTNIERLDRFYQDSAAPLDAMMSGRADTTPEEQRILADIKATEQRTLPIIQTVIALRSMPEAPRVSVPLVPGLTTRLAPKLLLSTMPRKLTPLPMVTGVLPAVLPEPKAARSELPGTVPPTQLESRSRASVLLALGMGAAGDALTSSRLASRIRPKVAGREGIVIRASTLSHFRGSANASPRELMQ